jgi:hypothetical protein
MTDQIIDRKQVFLPGPIGETGPAGPVNPDSVPTDQAIAEWIGSESTLTHAAITKRLYSIDPSLLDRTGIVDMAPVLNAILTASAGQGGCVIPPGVYALASSLVIPTDTPVPFALIAHGARFVAIAQMDALVVNGGAALGGPCHNGNSITGGVYDANWLAGYCIWDLSNNGGTRISGFVVSHATKSYMRIGDDSDTYGHSLNTLVCDAKMFGDGDYSDKYTPQGVYGDASDFKLDSIDIFDARIGVNSNGFFVGSNLHVYSKGRIPGPRVAFSAQAGAMLSNVYPDWCDIGVREAFESEDGALAYGGGSPFIVDGMFFYRPDKTPMTGNVAPYLLNRNSNIKISNTSTILVKTTYQNDAYGTVLLYADPADPVPVADTGTSMLIDGFGPTWGFGFVNEANNISNKGVNRPGAGPLGGSATNAFVIGAIPDVFGYYAIRLTSSGGDIDETILFNAKTWFYSSHANNSPVKVTSHTMLGIGPVQQISHHNTSSMMRLIYLYSDSANNSSISLDAIQIEVKSLSPFYSPHSGWNNVPTIAPPSAPFAAIPIGYRP